ncbi:MAG TPA: CapA family protein [Caulobacteraceae bacterium]|nr:CapA family protein [Caulobacteraceae bacterium]
MSEPMKVLLVGDVMTGRGIDQILPHPAAPGLHERWMVSAEDYVRLAEVANGAIARPAGFDYPWGDALPARRAAAPDLVIANLETAITRHDRYAPKGINYRMNPKNVGCLTAAGVDACALANNHVLDWRTRGLIDTLGALRAAGIQVAGAGRNLPAARAPAILSSRSGGRVLLIACAVADSGTPPDWAAGPRRAGVNLVELSDADVEEIAARLAAVRKPGDVAVVSIHWGSNWGYEIAPRHRRFAHALIRRAGVAIVHGHSSHHPKGAEVFDGRLILYGCGDFLNDYEGIEGYEAFRGDLVAAYLASVDAGSGELRQLEILPFQLRRFRLTNPAEDDVRWLRERLDRECAKLGAHVAADGRRLRLAWGDGA